MHGGRHREGGRSRGLALGHDLCDRASGAVILGLAVFTPWALGTTQPWSIRVAHLGGAALWILLAAKWAIRRVTGHRPARWSDPLPGAEGFPGSSPTGAESRARRGDAGTLALALGTVLFTALVAISYVNARADFGERAGDLVYFDSCIRWLPHSYDRGRTGEWLRHVLALAGLFWGVRDWIGIRTARDEEELRAEADAGADPGAGWVRFAPAHLGRRLRQLLWVLCLSGAGLAIVGALQRAAGTNKLLFLVEPRAGRRVDSVFGPWSYRSSAGQYFNLLWPLCVGFWVHLQERAARRDPRRTAWFDGPQVVLIPVALCLIGGAAMAGSRGAAGISILLGAGTVGLLVFGNRAGPGGRVRRMAAGWLTCAGIVACAAGGSLVWERWKLGDTEVTTWVEIEEADCSILARLTAPTGVRPGASHLLAMGAFQTLREWYPGSFYLTIDPQGALFATFQGATRDDVGWARVPDFCGRYGGREVTLAIQRGDSLEVFVDGQRQVPGPEDRKAPPSGWRMALWLDQCSIRHRAVMDVALGRRLLTPAELGAPLGREVMGRLAAVPAEAGGEWYHWKSGFDWRARFGGSSLAGRTEIWKVAQRIALDHRAWGTGLGTFSSVYELYKKPRMAWAAYAHDDWLEARVTVGWVGMTLIVGLLAALAWRIGRNLRGARGGGRVPALLLRLGVLGLAGCLMHARYDLPFQVYSVIFLFVLVAGVLAGTDHGQWAGFASANRGLDPEPGPDAAYSIRHSPGVRGAGGEGMMTRPTRA